MRPVRLAILPLLAVTLFVPAVAAHPRPQAPPPQQAPPPPPDGSPQGRGDGVEIRPAQVQQLFDAMLVMQSQEALSLTEQQYGQFLTRLRVLQETRRKNQQERARLINDLQRLTNVRKQGGAVNEGELKERLNSLHEVEARSAADMRKAYDSIDEVLDAYQQARFRVFEEQIERRKLELIMRARQQNREQRPIPPRRPPG